MNLRRILAAFLLAVTGLNAAFTPADALLPAPEFPLK